MADAVKPSSVDVGGLLQIQQVRGDSDGAEHLRS